MKNSKCLITIPNAAKRIGCSTPTLRLMIKEGRIPTVRVGKRLRVNERILKLFIAGNLNRPSRRGK